MPNLLIVGCGFVGQALADLATAAGWQVFAWTATPESAATLASKPFPATSCDITLPTQIHIAAANLPTLDVVVDCVSAGRGATAETYRSVYFEGAKNLLTHLACQRVLFTSSTSVYAQTDGSVVTESSSAEPTTATGKVLRETEDLILQHHGSVLRLAGLYGPGRSVMLKRFLSGMAIIEGDGERFINQIHRDDAAQAILQLLDPDVKMGIYNASDNNPISQRDLYTELASHFNRSMPPTGPRNLKRKRGWSHKQVSNAKLRATGWEPRFPTLLDALEKNH